MRKLVLTTILIAVLPAILHAQGSRLDLTAFTVSSGNVKVPSPAASISVCTQPANSSTTPCSPLATLYTDSTISVTCNGSNGCANPTTADANGNAHVYVAPGKYTVQTYGTGLSTFVQADVVAPCDPSNCRISLFAGSLISNIGASPTGATESVNTATITTTATCFFVTNQAVTIAGVGVSGYNGAYAVLSPGCNGTSTFSYTATTSGLAASGGGTATGSVTFPNGLSITGGAYSTTVPGTHTGQENFVGPLVNTGTDSGAQTISGVKTFTAGIIPTGGINFSGKPWFDVGTYGGVARTATPPTTTATTTAGSQNVSLPGGAIDFVNGDGIVIWKAGAATTQTTPAAPTVTSPVVSGTKTYSYKCVGVDSGSGLSAASAAGSVTTGPAAFGAPAVTISSISQASGVVTVNTATPISAVVGQQVNIVNVTGAGAGFVGVYAVATAPTTSQFTYALAGNAGAGTVSSTSFARLVNAYNITAISRSGTTISITTNAAHNYLVNTASNNHTIAIVTGVDQTDLNGEYVVLTASGSSLTLQSPISATETGTLTGVAPNQPLVWVYEYNTVSCPAVSGTTVQYYVYGDNGTGTYSLIGKTLYNQAVFTDWGPFFESGFLAPGYVPTTPPTAAQNQLFAGQISTGAGTTSLVLKTTVPSSVTVQTALHDESQAIAVAIATIGTGGGPIFLAPSPAGGAYYINAPLAIPAQVTLWVSAPLILNETIQLAASDSIIGIPGRKNTTTPQFGHQGFVSVSGLASPMVEASGSSGGLIYGLDFNEGSAGNGQNYVFIGQQFFLFRQDFFSAGGFAATIPLAIQGSINEFHIMDCQFSGYFNSGTQQIGQSAVGNAQFGPAIPTLLLRGAENGGGSPSALVMDGINTFGGRGILFDGTFSQVGQNHFINIFEFQAPSTPSVMLYGASGGPGFHVANVLNDSLSAAVLANWLSTNNNPTGVTIDSATTSPTSLGLVTGNAIPGLVVKNTNNGIGQNFNYQATQVFGTDVGAGFDSTAAVRTQAEPLILAGPTPSPLAVQLPRVTGVTATVSGAGTITSNTWVVVVTAVGWNGGQSAQSLPATVTVNGSQGVLVSWTAIAGGNVQGYDVGMIQSSIGAGGGGLFIQNSAIVAGTSFTITTVNTGFGKTPILDGTGLPLIDKNQVATPLLRLTNGFFKLDQTVGTLTANRAINWGDGGGTPLLGLSGVTGSIGGAALAAGACASGTVTVTGAVVGMPVAVSASDGTSVGGSFGLSASVTSANTVTVEICAFIAATPTAKTYNVRIIQ